MRRAVGTATTGRLDASLGALSVTLTLSLGAEACSSCDSGRDGVGAVPTATAPASPRPDGRRAADGHPALAAEIRDAVVLGDLERARRGARELARVRLAPASSDVSERLLDLHVAATELGDAADVDESVASLGVLVKSCADCHARIPGFALAPSRVDHGASWASAVDRMWRGVVGGSEDEWRSGAALLNAPHDLAELAPGGGFADAGEALVASARALVSRARSAGDADARAEAFGEVVASCAACHERTRRLGRAGAESAPPPPSPSSRR